MSKAKKTFSAIILALILLFLAALPKYVLPVRKSPGLIDWLSPAEEPFRGEITIWHIVRFKPYQGSVSTVLKAAAKAVEKRHFGVYLNVISMSESEAGERIARGEKPDIISFPSGFVRSDSLRPLDGGFGPFDSLGTADGSLLAVPYAASCRLLLYYPSRITPDEAREIPDTSKDMTEAFRKGRTDWCVSDARTAGEMARLEEANKAEHFEAEPVDDSTRLVQFIGLAVSSDAEAKSLVSIEFIQTLLGEKCSRMLADIGLYPLCAKEFPSFPASVLDKAYKRIMDGEGPVAGAFDEDMTAH